MSSPALHPPETTDLPAWCQAHGEPYALLPGTETASTYRLTMSGIPDTWEVAYRIPDAFFGRIGGATILPNTHLIVTPDRRVVFKGLTGSNRSAAAEAGALNVETAAAAATTSIDDECVFLGGSANFGHFVFESLLRLPMIAWLPRLKDLPIVVWDHVPNRFLDYLSAAGYPASRRLTAPHNRPLRMRAGWFVSAPMFRESTDNFVRLTPDALHQLRTMLSVEPVARPPRTKRSRLFLSRSSATWRRIVNRRDVQHALDRFAIVDTPMTDLSARDQLRCVGHAELIVVEQGAGGAMTLFAPLDCPIIEIASPNMMAALGTLGFAAVLGQPFARAAGRVASPTEVAAGGLPANQSSLAIDADYVIDIGDLTRKLTAADAACAQH